MANSNNNLDKKLRETLASRGLTVKHTPGNRTISNKKARTLNNIHKIERGLGLHGEW